MILVMEQDHGIVTRDTQAFCLVCKRDELEFGR